LTYLLDTNVVSALRKPNRSAALEQWLRSRPLTDMYLSAVTVGEIEKGIAAKRERDAVYAEILRLWRDQTISLFAGRILPFKLAEALRWGTLVQRQPDDEIDMIVAATALEHDLILVTLNVADFRRVPGLRLENPLSP